MMTLFKTISASVAINAHTNLLTSLLLESGSGLQTIYLLLITIFPPSSQNAYRFTEFLKQITSIFTTWEILGPGTFSYSAIRVICFAFLGYLILLSLLIILLFFRSSIIMRNTKDNPTRLVSKLLRAHSRVVFFIAHYYFLKFLTNSSDKTPEGMSWTWWTILAYSLNLIIAVLNEGFFFQRAKIKDAYAAHTNLYHQITLSHKLFGLTVYFLVASLAPHNLATGTAVVHIVFTLAALAALYRYLPFYDQKIMKVSIISTSLQLALAIVLILKAGKVEDYILEALCMFIPPFIIKISLIGFRWKSERILNSKPDKPQEALHFAVILKRLAFGPAHPSRHLRRISKESIVSNGLLCDAVNIEKGIAIESEKEYKQMVYLYILRVLEEVATKHPKHSTALTLYMAKIYLKRLNNESQALKLIMKLRSQDLSLTENNSLKRFNVLMEETIRPQRRISGAGLHRNKGGEKEEIDVNNIDVQSYFRTKEFVDSMRKDIYQEVSNHLGFWQAIKSDELDIKAMFEMCQNIENLSVRLRRYYNEELGRIQNYCCASIIMFSVYLHLIREIPEDSNLMKRFMRYLKGNTIRHALDMYSKEVAVIVSPSQGSTGVILNASGSTQTIFEMEKSSKLIGKSINNLFPTVFARQYLDFLSEYIKTLSSESENKFKTFAKTASGHLFEVEIFFKVYPEISQEMRIMAMIKPLPSPHHLLLLDHDGHILDCDAQLAKDLNISSSSLGYLNIQKLCPSFQSVNKAFNTMYSNEWEFLSRGTKRDQSRGLDLDRRMVTSMMVNKLATDQAPLMSPLMSPKYPQHTENNPLISPKSPTETMPMVTFPAMDTQPQIHFNFKTSQINPTETLRTEQSDKQTYRVAHDKAQEVCEGYLSGKKISFSEYGKETARGEEQVKPHKEVEYDVRIEPYAVDGRVYKMLRLENPLLQFIMKDASKSHLKEVASAVATRIKSQKTLQILTQRNSQAYSQAHSQASSLESRSRGGIPYPIMLEKRDTGTALGTKVQQTDVLNSIEYQGEEPEALNESQLFPEDFMIDRKPKAEKSSMDSSRASQDKVIMVHKAQHSLQSSKHSSMISAKSERGRSMRALHHLLDSKGSYYVTLRALVVMYLVILALLGLSIVNYSYSVSSINSVKEELNANNLVNVRLCAAMQGWTQTVRLLVRASGWRTSTQAGVETIQGVISKATDNLNTDNNNIQALLAVAKTRSLFNRMSRKDITYNFSISGVTSIVGPLNSFVGTDLLVNKYSEVPRVPYSNFYSAESLEILLNVIVNVGNDYLVSSESVMTETEALLSDATSKSVTVLKLILILVFVTLLLFIVAFLIIANSIVTRLTKLFQAVIRTEQYYIDKKILRFEQVRDLFEEDIQNDKFISSATNFLYSGGRSKDKKQQDKLLRSSHKSLRTLSLMKVLGIYLLLAVVLILVLCGIFIEGLINTISSFHSLDTINNQMSVLSKAQYQASALTGIFYLGIMYHNSTGMTVRHDKFSTQMEKSLSFFAGVNDNILSAFPSDEKDEVIEDLLKHKMCKYLNSLTQASCYAGTMNDTLNILTLNSYFYTRSAYYYNTFKSEPTEAIGRQIIPVYFMLMQDYINALDAAYSEIIDYIVGNVNTTVTGFTNMKLVRFIIILLMILVCVIVIQNVTVKAFGHYDRGRGCILKIMGMDIIIENKALIYYLRSEFDKKGHVLRARAFK